MARNFSTELAGQIGESLVVSELGRRGWVATAFSGNVSDVDLLAYRDGVTRYLQVKAWRAGSVSFDATRFLKIRCEGDRQVIDGVVDSLDAGFIYLFVRIGEKAGLDRYFVLSQMDVANQVENGYDNFLAKHDGVRPRNAATTHKAVTVRQLADFEDNWGLLDRAIS